MAFYDGNIASATYFRRKQVSKPAVTSHFSPIASVEKIFYNYKFKFVFAANWRAASFHRQ